MKPEHRKYFADLSEARLLGLCIWAEARVAEATLEFWMFVIAPYYR